MHYKITDKQRNLVKNIEETDLNEVIFQHNDFIFEFMQTEPKSQWFCFSLWKVLDDGTDVLVRSWVY